ncbi:MAG: helix-turn-helix domain-containing protein [Rikenellaceae bacterium]|nr:helix-turn-helix domain-containing protein [Rikenellaceae bacterium]
MMVIWSRDTNEGPELGEDYPKQELRGCFHEKILNQLRAECLPEGLDGYICNLKKSLHKSFHGTTKRWIMEHRLQIARALLLSTDMSIEQISTYCHLPKPTHFIVHFRHYYNISPIKLRELHRK